MQTSSPTEERAPLGDRSIRFWTSVPFVAVHVAAVVGVVWLGWSWRGAALAAFLYYARMFFVTGAYHRYFSHRSFRTSRAMQLFFAFFAMTSSQKGVLWWASHHRAHHKFSDQEGDVHSVLREGFLWSHVGWILSRKYEDIDSKRIRDFAKYPELAWLDRFWWLPPATLAAVLFAVGGWFALVWGFFVSTTLLWHGTFTINSLSHMFGTRRYAISDNSRNNPLLAAITMGEGWHNNHHHYQRSVRQGFFWWEIDPTYYVLRGMEVIGLVWDLHAPPAHILAGGGAVQPSSSVSDSASSSSVSSAVPAGAATLSAGLRVPDATLEG
jgi:stearoyl-CoA desaturase (delta-9 desaturase)